MGGSLLPRKNPFMAQGLVPGVRLRLDVALGDLAEAHMTAVEDVTEHDIAVLTPMKHLRTRTFAAGTQANAAYSYDRKVWRFATEFTGISSDGAVSRLRLPTAIESAEHRRFYRLQTTVHALSIYRLIIDGDHLPDDDVSAIKGMVVDLSEGGLCFTTRQAVISGERLGIRADLPGVGEIHARLSITGIDEPARGNLNRRVHCQFTDISNADRDRIARYLMRRQLELRRRGQI